MSVTACLQKALVEHMVYPAMERCRGNRVRKKTRLLCRLEAVNGTAYQRERLTELLLHCAAHVPAYRGLGLTPEEIRKDPYVCLRERVPVLEKQTFRANGEEYLSDNVPAAQRIPNQSGGSTGVPVHFYMDRTQVETYEAAR